MGQPRVIEVDYYVLIDKIKAAANAKKLVERTDKVNWKAYVDESGIRETSIIAHGKVMFANGAPRLVAITDGADWEGCYAYSIDDEAAIKYIP